MLGLLRVTLGRLQAHFGVLWSHFGVSLGHFRGTWGHLNLIRMTLDHFGTILGPLLVYESKFSKNLHFSNGF